MGQHYASLRKRPLPQYRQRFKWRLFPVPGHEARNPPTNHHGVDLAAIRKKIDMNRVSISEGKVTFPGLGVSKHPMTVVTIAATYVVGWSSRGGIRSIDIVGGPSLSEGKILFLHMGEPMVFTGPGEMVCITPPVVFIGRRNYREIRIPELLISGPSWTMKMPKPVLVEAAPALVFQSQDQGNCGSF
jgi:hypothetical protein